MRVLQAVLAILIAFAVSGTPAFASTVGHGGHADAAETVAIGHHANVIASDALECCEAESSRAAFCGLDLFAIETGGVIGFCNALDAEAIASVPHRSGIEAAAVPGPPRTA